MMKITDPLTNALRQVMNGIEGHKTDEELVQDATKILGPVDINKVIHDLLKGKIPNVRKAAEPATREPSGQLKLEFTESDMDTPFLTATKTTTRLGNITGDDIMASSRRKHKNFDDVYNRAMDFDSVYMPVAQVSYKLGGAPFEEAYRKMKEDEKKDEAQG